MKGFIICLVSLLPWVVKGQTVNSPIASSTGDGVYLKKTDDLDHPLLGTWEITEIHYQYPDTTFVLTLDYKGRLMISTATYAIMYNPYGTKRNTPASLSKMTDQEKLYSFQTIVFNSGTYSLTSTDLVTTADMAKVAGFEGGIQYYEIGEFEDKMTLTMYDETYPDGKKPEWFGKLRVRLVLQKSN